jgi:flagellar basal body-associated protein FliL
MVALVSSTPLSKAIGMNPSSIRSAESRRDSHGHQATIDDGARLWLIGLAVTAVLLAALVVGVVFWTTSSAQLTGKPCPNQQGSLNDAFFQDPADQSALMQSIQACSK